MLLQINGSFPEHEGRYFLAPGPNEAGSFITLETDETMGIDMTLGFRALAHIDIFSAWAGANCHTLPSIAASQ